jgi:hypothetical protein
MSMSTYPVSAEGSVVVASDGDAGVVLAAVLVGELEQLKTTTNIITKSEV